MSHKKKASLNIRHNLSSSKGPKPLQLKLLTTYIPKTSAFTLAFSTSQRMRTTRASARTFFTFRHYITPSARNFCRTFSSFFFQAEDGIRDHCVTGVQTCALPIWRRRSGRCDALRDRGVRVARDGDGRRRRVANEPGVDARAHQGADHETAERVAEVPETRSEERRVGKERRAQGASDQ